LNSVPLNGHEFAVPRASNEFGGELHFDLIFIKAETKTPKATTGCLGCFVLHLLEERLNYTCF
jgi:hypothetical protein